MTVQEIYKYAIEQGIKSDARSNNAIARFLERKNTQYEKLDKNKKQEFDIESLTNPFSDTRILNLVKDKEVKKIMVGIDIGVGELLLAHQMGDIDLVIAHHPLGGALANLHDVMDLQADKLSEYGVPINVGEALMKERILQVERGLNAYNHWREVDVAKLLGINFMCLHTAADNISAAFVEDKIKKALPERVEDVLSVFKKIEEYQESIHRGVAPKLFVGSPENRVGKLFVGFTGGTEPSPKVYQKMGEAGIGTIVDMHVAEEHKKEAESAYINVIIAGHMSSDSIGMNILIDKAERAGATIIPLGGFFRVSRKEQ